jgi:hypothetical protein
MEKKESLIKKLKNEIKKKDKKTLTAYLILRALVIICMILEIIHGEMQNALLCLLSLILFLLPSLVEKKLKIDLPDTLEIIIYLFIFAAEILGEINNFYIELPHWDDILHTINGFLCAAIGFSLFDLLNKIEPDRKLNLSPLYLCIVSFCVSMTIGVLWEVFEYSMDNILLFDMQKDTIVEEISTVTLDPKQNNETIIVNGIDRTIIYDKDGKELVNMNGYLDIGIHDTMHDLIVNFIGAFVFCVFGYFYQVKDKNKFIRKLMPRKI